MLERQRLPLLPCRSAATQDGAVQVLSHGLLCQKGEMSLSTQRFPVQVFPHR